ncbi:MAG: glycosyltransferase family 4 protein [Candidatus Omnitrophica bacterium]|nr:glycosyltransferase family 4 protein [Candidatus Omnitrophota bacterium]
MNIVFMAPEKLPVPPVRGGAVEAWIYEVAKRLKGHTVHTLCVYHPDLDNCPQEDFVARSYRPGILAKILLCSYKLPFKKDRSRLYYLPYVFWGANYCKKVNAEIIHIHARPQYLYIMRMLNPKARIIMHVHNVSNIEIEGKLWDKDIIEKADLWVTCSYYLKSEVLSRYPFFEYKVQVIYNGTDIKRLNVGDIPKHETDALRRRLNLREKDRVVLFSGRLVEYKGVHALIEAFKLLKKELSYIKLVILGGVTYSKNIETPYIRQIKASAAECGDNIVFTGFLPHRDAASIMRLADIFVVPSLWDEPFGVVCIEAMAMEKPVVAFAKGGIKEIIDHGVDGMLVEKTTPEALASQIRFLLERPDLCLQLGLNARKKVEARFTWENIAESTLSTYQDLIKSHGSQG